MKLINLMPVKRKKIISRMLIMGALSASSLLAYAQHQQVILSGNNLTLKEAFEQIERQTNLFIDYNVRDVNDSRIIQKLPARNEVQAVLNELLEGTGCSARFRTTPQSSAPTRKARCRSSWKKRHPVTK